MAPITEERKGKKRQDKVTKKGADNANVKNKGALVYDYDNNLVCRLHLLPLMFVYHFH